MKLHFYCPNCDRENLLDLKNKSFSCDCGKEYTLFMGMNRCVIYKNNKKTKWVRELLRIWIVQVRWANKYYQNGLPLYFLHKFGMIKDPSLWLSVYTFKEDIRFWWKVRKGD